MSGYLAGVSEVNGPALTAALDGLSLDDRHQLMAHLLGGLLCYVDPEDFKRVLASAVEHAAKWSREGVAS